MEGQWEENEYTIEGKAIHRRGDRIEQILPETVALEKPKVDDGDASPEIARSASLAADDLGLMGKLDLVSCDPEGGEAKDRCVREFAAQLKIFHPTETVTRPIPPDILRGWEGQAAAHYFAAFSGMLKTGDLPDFDFTTRNRRPPKDPVNALLSFAYALLVKECLVALWGEGLDPWWGLYHRPRHGRPALALDFMEPFRPILADSVVITAINTGMVKPRDFITNANGCAMQPAAKKALLRAWEQRLDQLHSHSEFGYRCS